MSLRIGACDRPRSVASFVTVSSADAARATQSVCAFSASFSPEQAERVKTANAATAIFSFMFPSCEFWSGGPQCSERADKSIEHLSSSKSGELERQRMRTSHLRLELYLVERRRNPLHAGHCVLAKSNTRLISAHQHRFDVRGATQDAQQRHCKEHSRRLRQHTEAIAHLFAQRCDFADVRQM